METTNPKNSFEDDFLERLFGCEGVNPSHREEPAE